MIIDKNISHNVDIQGFDKKVKYRVENTQDVAEVLAKKIYQDPIAAVVRELGTNAWDAHVDADKEDTKFNVIAPTNDNPVYTIRDYGKGLSPDDLSILYTGIGASNRTNSNLFTGALGFGSKAPFSYAQSFVTTSYYNGTKTVCINCINKEGEFEMSMSDPEPTDEPSGLEIKVPVKTHDIYKFENQIQKIFKWFPLYPNSSISPLKEKESAFSGSSWEIVDKGYRYSYGICKAIMGNVCYEVNRKYIPEMFKKATINLFFDIGEISFVPGRETLRYDNKTEKAIEERFRTIIKELVDHTKTVVKNADNYYDACVAYSSLIASFNVSFDPVPTYHSQALVNSILLNEVVYDIHISKRVGVDYCSTMQLATKEKKHFAINDIKIGAFKAGKAAAKKLNVDSIIVIPKESIEDFEKQTGLDTSDRSRFFLLSNYYVKSNSAIRRRGNKIYGSTFEFKSEGNSNYTTNRSESKFWEPCDIDLHMGGIYVDISNYKNNEHDINSLYRHMGNIDIWLPKDQSLIGVKRAHKHYFEKHPKWQHLFEYIVDRMNSLNKTFIREIEIRSKYYKKIFASCGSYFPTSLLLESNKSKIKDKNSEIYEMLSLLTRCDAHQYKYNSYTYLLAQFLYNKYQCDNSDITIPIDRMKKEYPVLSLRDGCDINVVVDTINTINSLRN